MGRITLNDDRVFTFGIGINSALFHMSRNFPIESTELIMWHTGALKNKSELFLVIQLEKSSVLVLVDLQYLQCSEEYKPSSDKGRLSKHSDGSGNVWERDVTLIMEFKKANNYLISILYAV